MKKQTIKRIGLLDFNRGYARLNKIDYPSYMDLARILLRRCIKEDTDLKFNPTGRVQYLKDFAENMTENSHGDGNNVTYKYNEIVDYVADMVLRCNAPHIIVDKTSTQVSSDFVNEIEKQMIILFEQSIEEVNAGKRIYS